MKDLFDSIAATWPNEPPSVCGSDTSVTAAKRVETKAGTDRRKVYDFIRERGEQGATDSEIQIGLDMTGDSERPRRWELLKAKYIRDSGKKRETPAGNPAVVWIAV